MSHELQGRRVLVTGTCPGVGREIARQLVNCGARVVTLARSEKNAKLIREDLPDVDVLIADLGDWNATIKALEQVGQVDHLVNSANIIKSTPIVDTNIEESTIDQMLAVNVKSVINLTQFVVKDWIKRNWPGTIVNWSSITSTIAIKDNLVLGASKAALDNLTKSMALEFGQFGIRVNSVNPGIVTIDADKLGFGHGSEKLNRLQSRTPLNCCLVEPNQVADSILFLLTSKSAMITGVNLAIDGGLSAC